VVRAVAQLPLNRCLSSDIGNPGIRQWAKIRKMVNTWLDHRDAFDPSVRLGYQRTATGVKRPESQAAPMESGVRLARLRWQVPPCNLFYGQGRASCPSHSRNKPSDC